MAKALLQSADFVLGLERAKQLAKIWGLSELSSGILLLGFAQCAKGGALSTNYPVLSKRLGDIEAFGLSKGFAPLDTSIQREDLTSVKMPLDKELKKALASSWELSGLLKALIDLVLQEQPSTDPANAQLLAAIQGEEGFAISNHYAHHLAQRHDLEEITAEVLTAGAYIALRKGELGARPAVASHLRSSKGTLELLFAHLGWDTSISGHKSADEVKTNIPLGTWVSELQRATSKGANPFAATINLGIRAANKLYMQRRVAYHEAGHAVLAYVLQPSRSIAKITILDEGNGEDADGYVAYDVSAPYYAMPTSRDDVLEGLCISLAGRVAEQRQYGHNEIDAGATSDLADATAQAWRAITEFGLDFDFGPVCLDVLRDKGKQSHGWLFDEAQKRLQTVMKEALLTTETLVDTHWEKIEAVALVLSEKKVLTEEEMVRVISEKSGLHLEH